MSKTASPPLSYSGTDARRGAKKLLGLVLAGGQSLRMGQDKAMMRPWGADGPTLLAHACNLLAGILPVCMVACAPGHRYAGYNCIEDARAFQGPANGVAAGLALAKTHGYQGILALACDLPRMTQEPLLALVQAYAASDAYALCFEPEAGGKIEMLAAIYSVDFLPALTAGISQGKKSLFWLVPPEKRQVIPYGPKLAPLFQNCNTPAEMAATISR